MDKQKEILKYLQGKELISLSEILANVPFGYYHNGKKHIGVVLSRMVNNGKIIRVKKGWFKINVTIQNDKDQLKLF